MQLPQLALNLSSEHPAVFSNFLAASNQQLVEHLSQLVKGLAEPAEFNLVYLWGSQASGKTHLLEAACHLAANQGTSYAYLNLAELSCITGLTQLTTSPLPRLLALDNLEALTSSLEFQQALFHLFNLAKQENCLLLVSAQNNPNNLGLQLADLTSRLAWGFTYQVHSLTDEDKLAAFKLKAQQRGIEVPPEVTKYLLYHSPRDLRLLLNLLDQLDQASLQAQRRLTLPFVRSIIM